MLAFELCWSIDSFFLAGVCACHIFIISILFFLSFDLDEFFVLRILQLGCLRFFLSFSLSSPLVAFVVHDHSIVDAIHFLPMTNWTDNFVLSDMKS